MISPESPVDIREQACADQQRAHDPDPQKCIDPLMHHRFSLTLWELHFSISIEWSGDAGCQFRCRRQETANRY
jgi:hypothetical protein